MNSSAAREDTGMRGNGLRQKKAIIHMGYKGKAHLGVKNVLMHG